MWGWGWEKGSPKAIKGGIKMISKIKTAAGILLEVENLDTYLAEYLGLIKSGYVVYTLRNGLRYKIRAGTADRPVINEVLIRDEYMPKGFGISEDDIVVDIGAHIGVFVVMAAKYAKNGKVYSFEPMPENFTLLKYNIRINGLKNVVAIRKAMSGKKGRRKLFINDCTSAHSFYLKTKKTIEVETTTFDDFVKEYGIKHINLLKMDCEGAEYDIFFNCSNRIFAMIDKISMEYHNIGKSHNFSSLKRLLESKGFEVLNEETKKGYSGWLYARRKG
jgi:FkbM family methyltransferase